MTVTRRCRLTHIELKSIRAPIVARDAAPICAAPAFDHLLLTARYWPLALTGPAAPGHAYDAAGNRGFWHYGPERTTSLAPRWDSEAQGCRRHTDTCSISCSGGELGVLLATSQTNICVPAESWRAEGLSSVHTRHWFDLRL